MASVTIGSGSPYDMGNAQSFYGYVAFASSAEIEIVAGAYAAYYFGVGFSYIGDSVVAGTLTSASEYSNGNLVASVSGISVPAPTAYSLIQQNRLPDFFALGLSGNDLVVGSGANDVIEGFGGNDILKGQPSGIDTAAFSGRAGSYSIVGNAQGFIVSGPDGIDQLISIKNVRFSDQTISLVPTDFDNAYYLAHNSDVRAAGVDPVAHFSFAGWKEGRNPDAFLDVKYYLNQNPDVRAAGVDPLLHYETSGWREGRDPSSAFSTTAYLKANPDVARANVDPLSHYLHSGASEHRMIFVSTPHGVGPQDPLVDNAYYFSHNPDVSAAGVNPYTHYDVSGWHEGRNPDAFFDTNYYLQHNPDVKAAGIDPMTHYELFGWKEGRDPSAQFSTSKYLNAYTDVKAAKLDPLVHYEQFGLNEGRTIFPA